MRYRFIGVEPEDFAAPPIARRLEPGDIVEVDEPVEHARLELQKESKGKTDKTSSGKED